MKSKICLGTIGGFGLDIFEQIKLFKKVGLDGFFTGWTADRDFKAIRKLADDLGIAYQSIHAPYGSMADIWENGEKADIAKNELIACVKSCAEINVPIMVAHVIIGFDKHTPNKTGIKNLKKVVDIAKELGIKVAFENTEGEEYLDAVMAYFEEYDNVGFCWDTGHEMCYNRHRDMMVSYADRLIATHLNDNLGISADDGTTIWTDDLHLLPFDGIADWEGIAKRIAESGFDGFLTFELNVTSKPDRHENDVYAQMPQEEYVTEVYKCACRLAEMIEKFQ